MLLHQNVERLQPWLDSRLVYLERYSMVHHEVEYPGDSGFGVSTNGLKTKVAIQVMEEGNQARIFLTVEETKKLIDLLNEKLKVVLTHMPGSSTG